MLQLIFVFFYRKKPISCYSICLSNIDWSPNTYSLNWNYSRLWSTTARTVRINVEKDSEVGLPHERAHKMSFNAPFPTSFMCTCFCASVCPQDLLTVRNNCPSVFNLSVCLLTSVCGLMRDVFLHTSWLINRKLLTPGVILVHSTPPKVQVDAKQA